MSSPPHQYPTWGIHALPVELMGFIFEKTLVNEPFSIPDPRAAPLLLCGVCSRWRAVAISTPRLWTSLSLQVLWDGRTVGNSKSIIQSGAVLNLARMWLNRSSQLPIDIQLRLRHTHSGDNCGFWPTTPRSDILEALVKHAARWKRVDFIMDIDDTFIQFPPLPSTGTPLLVSASLKILGGWEPHGVAEKWMQKLVSSSPRLVDLAWSGLESMNAISIPRVKSLDLSLTYTDGTPGAPTLDNILQLVPELDAFRIALCYARGIPGKPFQHDGLKSLTIDARQGIGSLKPILDILTLPSLKCLTIICPEWKGMSESQGMALMSLLQRPTPPPLESLTLVSTKVDPDILERIIAVVEDSLTTVIVDGGACHPGANTHHKKWRRTK